MAIKGSMWAFMRSNQRGQTLPMVALFLLVLLGMLALALDAGFAYAQRRYVQNAADAGALSAMTIMASGETRDSEIRATASYYAQQNRAQSVTMAYLDSGKHTLSPSGNAAPNDAKYIRVSASLTFSTFFARILGIGTMTVSAQATAHAFDGAWPGAVSGLVPLSVPTNFYNSCSSPTSSCNIWDSQYWKSWDVPANFKGLVDLSDGTAQGSMPQNLEDWTRYGYPGTVAVNSWLPIRNGDLGHNIAGALRDHIAANPAGPDPDGVLWGSINVPVWNAYSADQVRVVKFARFKVRITEISGSSAWGHFIDWVVPGYSHGGGSGSAGPKVVLLTD